MPAVKRVEFVSDRMSYTVLRGCWCSITVLYVHAPSEGKSDDSEYCFYKELGQVSDYFPKYHMEILLEILMQNLGDRIFSNRQLGRRLRTSG